MLEPLIMNSQQATDKDANWKTFNLNSLLKHLNEIKKQMIDHIVNITPHGHTKLCTTLLLLKLTY